MNQHNKLFIALIFIFCLALVGQSCNSGSKKPLPVLGEKTTVQKMVDGKKVIDSIDHVIPNFSLTNQDGQKITEATVDGKVYITDFFFTSCPTICPKVKQQMKKVYSEYKHRKDFLILSHSIDVKHDTVGRLAWYAKKLDISSDTWHLLTGNHNSIYRLAGQYLIAALVDKEAPGGFDHSGAIALVDRQRRIRGLYDGTNEEEVKKLIKDIRILLAEKTATQDPQ